jgi:D-sedoheptulose 7-phosphate isomerase
MTERTDFLYPFIDGDERDVDSLLVDLTRSARAKHEASSVLRAETLAGQAALVQLVAGAMATRFSSGGRLFTFGNGGSATDAASVSALFAAPPYGVALPARNLAEDPAILTALGNDVGFDLVFSRQLIAHAAKGDIVLGISTSGGSRNVLTAMREAHDAGMLTVGLAGYGGGELAQSPDVDHCLVVDADSVHRIQETQDALACALWLAVQDRLDLEDV